MVQAARPDDASQVIARNALQKLCRMYWYPLYAYVRHRGYSDADAKDLTQAFFARMLQTDGFSSADRLKGRFRSFLLGAMKHFLANEWHRDNTKKRGGDIQFVEWDSLDAGSRYETGFSKQSTPDSLYDREWAMETVKSSLDALRREMRDAGKESQFDRLKGFLTGSESGSREELANQLNISENTLKVTIHRLRKRFRELLRATVIETIDKNENLEVEMKYLIAALSS